jgi:DNA (cytosine-5)-methyltransferase 1
MFSPLGSGLKRYVTIKDALQPMQQQFQGFTLDPYHQPTQEKFIINGETNDPHVNLARCITTSGGTNVHYSGTRAYTVRELSMFQGFRTNYQFTGAASQAKMQCRNAWPVKACKVYFGKRLVGDRG